MTAVVSCSSLMATSGVTRRSHRRFYCPTCPASTLCCPPGPAQEGRGEERTRRVRRAAQHGKEGVIMLVLARRVGQDVVIDGRIVVTVLSVKGRRVRLGVAASPFTAVDRGEVHR